VDLVIQGASWLRIPIVFLASLKITIGGASITSIPINIQSNRPRILCRSEEEDYIIEDLLNLIKNKQTLVVNSYCGGNPNDNAIQGEGIHSVFLLVCL
jgi:hypothetical protein